MVSHPASHIDLDIAEGLAVADRTRVSQIVHNLISNAERHGRPPIAIVGRNGGPMWSLSVTDQGDGIPAEEQESIFGSFAQGSHHGEGMGMGLSVSRRLARAMGGDLVVDGGCQDGTRFVLSLPSA